MIDHYIIGLTPRLTPRQEANDFEPVAGVENHKFVDTLNAGENFFDFRATGFELSQGLETRSVVIGSENKQIDVLQKLNVPGEAFAQKTRAAAGASASTDGDGESVFAKTGGQDQIALRPAGVGGGTKDSFFSTSLNDLPVEGVIIGNSENEEGSVEIGEFKGSLDKSHAGQASDPLANGGCNDGEVGSGLRQFGGFAGGDATAADHEAAAPL